MGDGDVRQVRYDASGLSYWIPFLFGNVPGHQLDWILMPDNLPPELRGIHVQHLNAHIRNRDALDAEEVVLTFGNLSTRDTLYVPGHGALAIIVHVRVPDQVDHAGRPNPRFTHALVTAERDLPAATLRDAARHLLDVLLRQEDGRRSADVWYGRYVEASQRGQQVADALLREYLEILRPTPPLLPAHRGESWTIPPSSSAPQVDVLCPPDTPLSALVEPMAMLTADLCLADTPWSAVTTRATRASREDGGFEIQFARHPIPPEAQQGFLVRTLSELPPRGAAMARRLLANEPSPLPVASAPLDEPAPLSERPPPPPLRANPLEDQMGRIVRLTALLFPLVLTPVVCWQAWRALQDSALPGDPGDASPPAASPGAPTSAPSPQSQGEAPPPVVETTPAPAPAPSAPKAATQAARPTRTSPDPAQGASSRQTCRVKLSTPCRADCTCSLGPMNPRLPISDAVSNVPCDTVMVITSCGEGEQGKSSTTHLDPDRVNELSPWYQ